MHSAQGDQNKLVLSETSTQRRKGRSLSSEQWKALKAYADANEKDRRMVLGTAHLTPLWWYRKTPDSY